MLRYTPNPQTIPQNVIASIYRTSSAGTAFTHLTSPRPVPNSQNFNHRDRVRHNSNNHTLRSDLSAQHHNLTTFLDHASRTSLSPTSTTYLGTRYEYLVQTHLTSHLGFTTLTRVGGRGDSGIDLQGTWSLPQLLRSHTPSPSPSPSSTTSSSTPSSASLPTQSGNKSTGPDEIRVLVQCKRHTRTAGPNLIRELEGSFQAAPTGWRGDNVLGILACSRAATKGVRDTMGSSRRGLVWMLLEEEEQEQQEQQEKSSSDGKGDEEKGDVDTRYRAPRTRIRQFLYNAAAAEKCGLLGVDVGLNYDDTGVGKEVQLLWQGLPIDFTRLKTMS